MNSAIDYAKAKIRTGLWKETQGQNRGPKIDDLNRRYHYDLGSSWCALFAVDNFYDAIRNGAEGLHILKTAGSQALLGWFRELHLTSTNVQDLLKWKGALAIRTNPDGEHGHVTMLAARFTTGGKIVAVGTAEGNTDKYGGANGDGAYERKRTVPMVPYKWTFCNTTPLAGGQWW